MNRLMLNPVSVSIVWKQSCSHDYYCLLLLTVCTDKWASKQHCCMCKSPGQVADLLHCVIIACVSSCSGAKPAAMAACVNLRF